MMRVWQPIVISNADHPRYNTAGYVYATNAESFPENVVVKFDTDNTLEDVLIADLKAL